MKQLLCGLGLVMLAAMVACQEAQQEVKKPDGQATIFQVTGDPPVTVSDGSLHAHSANKWTKDGSDGDMTIQPVGAGLAAATSCQMKDQAAFCADDTEYQVINPGATIIIHHDPSETKGGTDAESLVTIKVPNPSGGLTITSAQGGFSKSKGKRFNREHERAGEVTEIDIDNPVFQWKPKNPHNPHFTLAFCYQ